MTPLEYALLAAGSLFAIINPLAAVPAFLAMTPHDTLSERLVMARRACVTAGAVLLVFALVGQKIFKLLGISLPSFQIAGGLILLLISVDGIRAKRSAVQETEEETREGTSKEDVSITPLAVPMLSGPGAITTVIVLETKALDMTQLGLLYGIIAGISAATYLVFVVTLKGAKRINPIVMNVTTRLMGLMLGAIGIEFILSALRSPGVLR